MAVDSTGLVYLSDSSNYAIRRVDTSGIITTVTGNGSYGGSGNGGPASSAENGIPQGLTVDIYNSLYFADEGCDEVRKITF